MKSKKSFCERLICFLILSYSTIAYSQNRNLELLHEVNQATLLKGSQVAWSSDSFYLAVGYKDEIFIVDTNEFEIIKKLRGQINNVSSKTSSIEFSPDGEFLISGHEGGIIFIWFTKTWNLLEWISGIPRTLSCGPVPSISFNQSGSLLASGDWNNKINIWSVNDWLNIKEFRNSEPSEELSKEPLINQSIQLQVRSIDFSPDSRYLATGGNDRIVRIWSTKTWKNIASLEGHEHWISSVTFSPNGKYLASGGHNGEIFLWNTDNWALVNSFYKHEIRCLCVAFSTDGKYLVSGGDNGELFVFNTDNWENVVALKGHRNSVISVSFSPDSKYLASLDPINLRIWSTETWRLLKSIPLRLL